MIVALVKAGKRIGITANSHKVITNLLNEACEVAQKSGTSLSAIQKSDSEDVSKHPFVRVTSDNADVVRGLATGEASVVAGTSWLWARDDMTGAVDVLFVDEAGQMSLANALASSRASSGLVLLGDPQQLDQPTKGVHPPGTRDFGVLGHILGGHATIDEHQGLFLEETWRMHPDVCRFVSDTFYEGRLRSKPELSRMRLDAPTPVDGTGLRFVPVEHNGNQSASAEEAEMVARLVERLTEPGSTWTDPAGVVHALRLEDVLIVAPYNAHVAILRKRLPGARVGTVDKFQGQEAPVVI